MRRSLMLAVAAALTLSSAGCMAGMGVPSMPDAASYAGALAEPSRPAADRERDAARHAAETLAFARVRPGQQVTDMIIGGGYFTRVFAAAVGPQGHVTAWQPAEFMGFQASYREAADAADAMANVDANRAPIATPAFPADQDLFFTAQNYHDLHLTPFGTGAAARVNAAVFAALKPGGLYVIVDHDAATGSGLSAPNTLHRIDIEAVKREVTAAGFVLDGESALLANPADPRTANVFDASIRGQTSQFMLRFKKPR